MPSLLQVEAILRRLTGGSALTEVARFLKAQFPHYAWVGFFRREPTGLLPLGWDGGEPASGSSAMEPGARRTGVLDTGRSAIVRLPIDGSELEAAWTGARSAALIPVRDGGEVVGLLEVDAAAETALDATDQRFLESVVAKLGLATRTAAPG